MHNFPTRVRIPDKVTMGIRLVMQGVMIGCGLSLMVVVRTMVRLIAVGVGRTEMRQECKRRMPTSHMVNQHMRRGEEKGKNESKTECMHSAYSV